MNNMSLNDKMKYLHYKLGIIGILLMLLLCLFMIISILLVVILLVTNISTLINNSILFIFAFLFIGSVVFLIRRIFIVFLSKKLFIIDGKILKKSKHRYPHDTIFPSAAKTMSNDNRYTTEWIPFKEKYFKYKEIPVKIIIKNNKGYDFYIADYSFKNKNNIINM